MRDHRRGRPACRSEPMTYMMKKTRIGMSSQTLSMIRSNQTCHHGSSAIASAGYRTAIVSPSGSSRSFAEIRDGIFRYDHTPPPYCQNIP